MQNNNCVYKIAIIGFGPKGLYGFERLISQIHHSNLDTNIEIHLYNRNTNFGSGDIYRCDQKNILLMNYPDKNIDFNINEEPKMICSIDSFVDWKKELFLTNELNGNYSPRILVGSYLEHCFSEIVKSVANNITIMKHVDTVTDIQHVDNRFKIKTIHKDWIDDHKFDQILLTTGHYWFRPISSKSIYSDNYVNFIYPVSDKLHGINGDSSVCIRGFGLTSIDTILELTEGRGGKFEDVQNGELKYFPSGNEPKGIAIFSRSGLPMIPRSGKYQPNRMLKYFTESFVDNLLPDTKIDFKEIILPLIVKECYFAYYDKLFRDNGLTLKYNDDFNIIKTQVENFHCIHGGDKFSWNDIENHFHSNPVLTSKMIEEKIRRDIIAVENGDPIVAAYNCWTRISELFNKIYSAQILTADSKCIFDSYYFGFFNRISYGPPIINMKKILALTECGMLNFDFAKSSNLKFNEVKKRYTLYTDVKKMEFDYLINATIPRGTNTGNRSLLFKNLLSRGMISLSNNDKNSGNCSSHLKLTPNGKSIDREGSLLPNLSFYGTPTEGSTFDNDTLSRTRNNNASKWAENILLELHEFKNK